MKANQHSVEADLAYWDKVEKMFPPKAQALPEFQKEKITFFEDMAARYGNSLNDHERRIIRIARGQRREAEKMLYPNRWERLARRVLRRGLRAIVAAVQNRRADAMERQITRQAAGRGFNLEGKQVSEKIREGTSFKVPLESSYLSENQKVDQQLSVKRENGSYQLDKLIATLTGADGQKRQASFDLSGGNAVNAQQAVNLLQGRAVEVNGKWMQLDLNDRDIKGNYKMKTFHRGDSYDMDSALSKVPSRQLSDPLQRQAITQALRNGETVPVTINAKGGKREVLLEANPQFKNLSIYDQNRQRISLTQPTGKNIGEGMGQVRKLAQEARPARKKGVSIG